MSIARPCPYSSDYENCKYEKYYGEPTLEKCGNCSRSKKENKKENKKEIFIKTIL